MLVEAPPVHAAPLAAHRAAKAGAERGLADEYDAAQERGQVVGQGKPSRAEGLATTKQKARAVRDAEKMIVEAVNKFPFPPDLRSGSQ